MKIDDISGKPYKAMDVFAFSIKYLKDHLIKTMKDRGIDSLVDEIQFVLTVPAIWRDSAKRFMREAVIQVSITSLPLMHLHLP